jgi:hypothetical protein
VEPGDAGGLASKVDSLSADQALRRRLGQAARVEFERRYTAEPNHEQLLNIYRRAIDISARSSRSSVAAL